MGVLSELDIDTFIRVGVVRIPGLVPEDTLLRWRSMFAGSFGPLDGRGADALRAAGSTDRYRTRFAPAAQPASDQLSAQPGVVAAVQQLGGTHFHSADNGWIVRWPDPAGLVAVPEIGHIDVYPSNPFPNDWYPFMLGISVYLYDVGADDGPTLFWPGSHHRLHAYLRENPHHVDGTFRNILSPKVCWARFTGGDAAWAGVGSAGDVFLWHANICHSWRANRSLKPRVALFARCRHSAQARIRHEVPRSIWKYWAVDAHPSNR